MNNQNDKPQTPQNPVPPLNQYHLSSQEDEINFLDIWQVLVKNKKIIFATIFVFTIVATIVALAATPIYRAEVLLAPASSDSVGDGRLGAIASQLGGFAGLAGISMSDDSDIETALAILESRKFLIEFIRAEQLKPVLFDDVWDAKNNEWIVRTTPIMKLKAWFSSNDKLINITGEQLAPGEPSSWDGIERFSKILMVTQDRKTGLVTVAIEWKDPILAANWANRLVMKLNSELRQRAINEGEKSIAYLKEQLEMTSIADLRSVLFKLVEEHMKSITLARTSDGYALKVIDPAMPPMKKIKPKRQLIIILGIIFGSMFAVVFVFVRQAVRNSGVSADVQV